MLSGADEGGHSQEILSGLAYSLTGHWDLRSSYQLPAGGTRDLDRSISLGFIDHC